MPTWGSGRALESLLGIGLLVWASKLDDAVQFTQATLGVEHCIVTSDIVPADPSGGAAPPCAAVDDPLLSMPVWWYDDDGARTRERECTPRRIRACLKVKDELPDPRVPPLPRDLAAAATDWCCLALADAETPYLPQMQVYKSLATYGVVLPAAACFLASLGIARGWWRRSITAPLPRRDLYVGLLWSHVFANVPVIIVKAMVGRPRPIFLALTLWAEHQRNLSDEQRETLRLEAVRSFPSGHASMAAAGCCYVSLFMLELVVAPLLAAAVATAAADAQPPQPFTRWTALPVVRTLHVVVFVWLPPLLAVWVGVTRIQDYWHHYGDVIAGSAFGLGGAWLSFHYVTPKPGELLGDEAATQVETQTTIRSEKQKK